MSSFFRLPYAQSRTRLIYKSIKCMRFDKSMLFVPFFIPFVRYPLKFYIIRNIMTCFIRQHRTTVPAALTGPFGPTVQFENLKIHPVFWRFSNFHLNQNGTASALVKLSGVAINPSNIVGIDS